ncbi:MAG: isoprenylcysteine carboxylmethyltransferase family protein [Gemmatimonadetes bacterium]|nr:isoprenylcysteine carboxylmethyltransferase family protein [Gemmatimonadota bacterium]
MNSVRYFVAVVLLISLPPGLLLWFVIHPMAGFWRKLGAGWTYAILGLPVVGMMVGLFGVRTQLVSTDFGTSLPLIALGAICVAFGITIAVKRKKYLTMAILAGIPELSRGGEKGKLLTEGIYGRIRHPRYVEALLGVLGYALIANYLGMYIMFALTVPAIYFIVVLEERELRDRFGSAYEEYSRRVPRFFPRRSTTTPHE